MGFNVGQIVKLINNEDMGAELGATAIIKYIDDIYIGVVWIRDEKWHNQEDGGYFPNLFRSTFEPISTKNQQLIFSFME